MTGKAANLNGPPAHMQICLQVQDWKRRIYFYATSDPAHQFIADCAANMPYYTITLQHK